MSGRLAKHLLFLVFALMPIKESFAQMPVIYMVPIDSLVFDENVIKNVEFVDYNNDDYVDYFISTDIRAYLIDSFSKDTIWASIPDTLFKIENLEFIESSNLWRNYRIEQLYDNVYKVLWYDLPSSIPSDSLIFESLYPQSFYFNALYAGFFPLGNEDGFYVQTSLREDYGMWVYNRGDIQIYNQNNNSLLFSSLSLTYVENFLITFNSEYFLIATGVILYIWYEMGGGSRLSTHMQVFNDTLGVTSAVNIDNMFLRNSDLFQQNEYTAPELLLAGSGNVYFYPNVFDGTIFLESNFPIGVNFAQFLNYQNERFVINAGSNSYFEIWDTNLNFNSYIIDQLPDSLRNIYTQDIDFDGTDEVFCVYDSKVLICGLFEQVDIIETELMPYKIGFKNYPNPFNASTMISYNIIEAAHVSLEIYDIMGRKIEVPVSKYQSAGSYSYSWDASNYPSGIYLARLKTDSYSQIIKMILLK